MSLITIIWSMSAAACLTLALLHFFVWCRQREAWANLLFALLAVATAMFAACELWMMQAETPEQFGTALRWAHAPAWLLVVSLAGFVHIYLNAGRRWLVWSICGLRTLSLLLNFLLGQNLNYLKITSLRHIPFLGESISVVEGVRNPWQIVGQTSLMLLLIFIADATLTVWRRGERRRALVVGGSAIFFVIVGIGESVLALSGVISWPVVGTIPFLGMVAAMGYELSHDILRAAQLGRDLRESEHRMAMAADAANLGIWIRDLTRNEIWASEKWRGLFGFTPSERLEFEHILQRLHSDDREGFQQVLAKALEGGGTYDTEFRLILQHGETSWISSHGCVEVDATGQPVRVRGVSLDITTRKQAELEVQKQRNEMAHLSRVTMLGELSGSMAHELNQPLTAILFNAQAAQRFLAHDTANLDEVRAILVDIVDQDNRASEIIRRLRLLLKKGVVQQLPLDVNDLVREVLKMAHSDILNHGVAAHTALAHALPTVNGDRVQLQQVLLNLVINACDAMNGNAPADRQLVLRTELSDGKDVLLSVSDSGEGIASERLERVFEPFFTTKIQGLGLGLSVCRTIIAAHCGKLWAANNPKRGTTFHFTLPVSTEAKP